MKTKKIVSLLLAILMMLSLSSLFVMAVDAADVLYVPVTHITAVAPTMDGTVSTDEYGAPVIAFSQGNLADHTAWKQNGGTSNAAQNVNIYMTNDETYLYVAATLDNTTEDTYTGVDSNATHRAMFVLTASRWDAQALNVEQQSGADRYAYYRVYGTNAVTLNPLHRVYSGGSNKGDTKEFGYKAGFDSNTYTYEMQIKWTDIPGFENGYTGNEQVALTMRLTETAAEAFTKASSYYTIGGDAAIEANPYSDGLVAVTPGDWCCVSDSVAAMPAADPTMDAVVNAGEYGAPVIITSPLHATESDLYYNNYYANDSLDTTATNAEQRVKIYMTNDEKYLYVAATMDHALSDCKATASGVRPQFSVTMAAYTATTNVPLGADDRDYFRVFRMQFTSDAAEGKIGVLSRQYGVDTASYNKDITPATGDYKAKYENGTYTYEFKIAWETIPGMEDGIYNGKQLAVTMRLSDGKADTSTADSAHYRIGGTAAINFTQANPHGGEIGKATGVLKLNINDQQAHAKVKVADETATTYFGSIDRAVAAATSGQTVTVLSDVTATQEVVVASGVTLDVNGKMLDVTGKGLAALNATVKDGDGTTGVGRIKAALTDVLSFNKSNEQLPLYQDGGYQLYTYTFETKVMTDNVPDNAVKYAIRLELPTAQAYALLAQEANQEMLGINLDLKNEDGSDYCDTIPCVFSEEIMKKYADMSQDLSVNYALVLTVYGIDQAEQKNLTLIATGVLATATNISVTDTIE